jgi:hypothetical protein
MKVVLLTKLFEGTTSNLGQCHYQKRRKRRNLSGVTTVLVSELRVYLHLQIITYQL